MLRILFFTLILFSSSVFAQVQEKPKAILQDLIGRAGDCDLGARLQNLYLTIDNSQNSYGVIITYQGVNALPFEYEYPREYKKIKKRLSFIHYDESKFKVIFGGFRSELETEFWFVPQGADEPQPTQTLPKPTIPTDRTFLYDMTLIGFEGECSECFISFEFLAHSAQKEIIKFRKQAEEEDKKNGIESTSIEEDTSFSKEEREEMKFYWTNNRFGEILKTQKDSAGIIIFYGDKKEYNIKALRSHVEQGKLRIAKESQILSSQIKIVYGGFSELPKVEFWVTPKGAKLPTPTPKKREVADSNQ